MVELSIAARGILAEISRRLAFGLESGSALLLVRVRWRQVVMVLTSAGLRHVVDLLGNRYLGLASTG